MVEIVVLANSVKNGQHCVAGKIFHQNQWEWIRPVADLDGKELSGQQASINNPHGTFRVKPLQKVRIGIEQHAPLPHQPDNYLIDNTAWIQNYLFDIGLLGELLDAPEDIWGEGNRVSFADIQNGDYPINQSLYLLQVQDLRLYYANNNQRRASFFYNGLDYDLPATDPKFDEIMRYNDTTDLEILCISLGEPYNGYCYKIIATIF